MSDDRHAQAHDAMASKVAELVIGKLAGCMISSSLPACIGDWIRKSGEYGTRVCQTAIPMAGYTSMGALWTTYPDGSLQLELQDTNGQRFWIGRFRAVDAT